MNNLPVQLTETAVVISSDDMMTVGYVANEVANRTAHTRYHKKQSANTKRRQIADLQLFFQFLNVAGYPHDCTSFLSALKKKEPLDNHWYVWEGVTHGLVSAFLEWQLQQGYTIGSLDIRLSTVKTYAKLAYTSGVLSQRDLYDIQMVTGYTHRQGINVDKERDVCRVGKKKAEPTIISPAHAVLLKRQKRVKDAAMMCLLLDLGLRVGELVMLKKNNVNIMAGTITFYREKVDKTQTHRLTPDCLVALQNYLPYVIGESLFSGHKGKPMTTAGINKRVGELGRAIGIEDLSPHDCRHHLLTEEAKKGTDVKTLQYIGGWSSPVQAVKYINDSEIANSGASFFRQ